MTKRKDPKVGTGKKPKGSGRRLYTDENPKDTVSIKYATVKDAREYENVGFQWTRRIIALTAIFSIVVLPKVVAIFYPEVAVTVGYTEFRPGFFFIPEKEVMEWKV